MNLFYFTGITILSIAYGNIRPDSASSALNEFALKFLVQINQNLPSNKNIIVSPYTTWMAMSVVNEGAGGNTAYELGKTLGIPSVNDNTNRESFRIQQKNIVQDLAKKQNDVTLEVLNSMFTKLGKKLNTTFQELVQKVYNTEVETLNFTDASKAAQYINNKLSNATHGRLSSFVTEDAVRGADMFITSALFFKGIWDKKFDKADTKDGQFFDENGKSFGTVPMMHNSGNFPYSLTLNNQATAVEMPYIGGRMSMIAILPTRNRSLSSILQALSETPISTVLHDLEVARETYQESEVDIRLPKFKLSTSLNLNDQLFRMGIQDVFDWQFAELRGISKARLYVSKVTHKAEIEVDEEGTVGSAVTVVEVVDRITAPFFNANKPFAFFVVDKLTHAIILMGRINNPTQNDTSH